MANARLAIVWSTLGCFLTICVLNFVKYFQVKDLQIELQQTSAGEEEGIQAPPSPISTTTVSSTKTTTTTITTTNPIIEKIKTVIILVAFHRSGSSFTGELLNQHPDVFYFYEPLHAITDGCSSDTADNRFNYLKRMINCDIPDLQKNNNAEEIIINEHFDKFQRDFNVDQNFLFRSKHRRLCEAPFCDGEVIKNLNRTEPMTSKPTEYCNKFCGPVNTELAKKTCSESKILGFKLIRFCEMELLKRLEIEMPEIDFKFVMLNRDPRGIYNSRKHVFFPDQNEEKALPENDSKFLLENLFWTCRWMSRRYKQLHKENKPENMLFLRYETISLNPLENAALFYNFTKLPFYSDLHTKIETMTGESILTDQKSESREPVSERPEPETYKTSKNSQVQYQNWRKHISIKEVLEVQETCKETMELLGYNFIYDDKKLLDFDNFSILNRVNFEN